MEFIKEASDYLQDKDYLTPYEKSVILARLQIKEFCSWESCKIWIVETAMDLLSSDDPKQVIQETGSFITIKKYNTAFINIRIFGKKYGGLQLIIDNDYPVSCFHFNPFLNVYGISIAIKNLFHFSLTYDFTDYSNE